MSSIVQFMSMQLGEQLATLNCLEFTFSEGGPKLARGDQFWLPELVRPDRFFRYRPNARVLDCIIR